MHNAQKKKTDKKFSEARTRLMGMASSLPYFATMSLHCAAVSSWFCSFLKNFCRSFAVSAVLCVAKRIMRTRATEVSGGKRRTTGVGNETQCVTVCLYLCLCVCLCASSLHPSPFPLLNAGHTLRPGSSICGRAASHSRSPQGGGTAV